MKSALLCLAAMAPLATPALAAAPDAPALYKAHCQVCHLADGNAPLAPMNFADGKWAHGGTPAQVAQVIAEGVAGTAMMPFKGKLSATEIAALAAHVRGFDKAVKGKAKK